MYFLTRLTVNANHPAAVRSLADTHSLHRLVYLGFPDADEGGPGRPLFRLEPAHPEPARPRPIKRPIAFR